MLLWWMTGAWGHRQGHPAGETSADAEGAVSAQRMESWQGPEKAAGAGAKNTKQLDRFLPHRHW